MARTVARMTAQRAVLAKSGLSLPFPLIGRQVDTLELHRVVELEDSELKSVPGSSELLEDALEDMKKRAQRFL